MAKILIIPESPSNRLRFNCPGCKTIHDLNATWNFNGDVNKPTISPSVLVTWTDGSTGKKDICHSFIVVGKIQFLGDCTHELVGQTVELPEINGD